MLIFLHKHLIRVADRRDLMEPTFSAEISCHAYMISTNAYHCARNRVFPTGGDVVWGSPPHQLKTCSYPPPPSRLGRLPSTKLLFLHTKG